MIRQEHKSTSPCVSKDKEKVRRWARERDRKVLWADGHGMWHSALDEKHVPKYAREKEPT